MQNKIKTTVFTFDFKLRKARINETKGKKTNNKRFNNEGLFGTVVILFIIVIIQIFIIEKHMKNKQLLQYTL